MRTMTAPAGRRRAAPARPALPRGRLAAYAVVVVLTLVAWFYLVGAAIDFGAMARDGETLAWLFTALATVGAIGCMLLGLVLVTRVLTLLGLIREQQPKRAAARRRAN